MTSEGTNTNNWVTVLATVTIEDILVHLLVLALIYIGRQILIKVGG